MDARGSGGEDGGAWPEHDDLMESVAGRRIRRGEQMLARLRSAVRARAANVLNSKAVRERTHRQLDMFADRLNKRWPDAFLAHEQAIEDILQSVASGGRAALLMSGEPVADPIQWEDDFASALLDDPKLPLTLEARRQPRPPVPALPNPRDAVWTQIRQRALGGTGETVEAAVEEEGLLQATLTVTPATDQAPVNGGPYRGWFWLGTLERRAANPHEWAMRTT
jgi:hypothetical protein